MNKEVAIKLSLYKPVDASVNAEDIEDELRDLVIKFAEDNGLIEQIYEVYDQIID